MYVSLLVVDVSITLFHHTVSCYTQASEEGPDGREQMQRMRNQLVALKTKVGILTQELEEARVHASDVGMLKAELEDYRVSSHSTLFTPHFQLALAATLALCSVLCLCGSRPHHALMPRECLMLS